MKPDCASTLSAPAGPGPISYAAIPLQLATSLLETHDVGICIHDQHGILRHANRSYLALLGLDDTGRDCLDLIAHKTGLADPRDRKLFAQGNETLHSTGHSEIEYRLLRDGEPPRWVEERTSLVSNGDEHAYAISFLVDISERKRNQQREAKLSRFLSILGQVNQAMLRSSKADELYREVTGILTDYGNFLACWIVVRDAADDTPTAVASAGISGEFLAGMLDSASAPASDIEHACRREMTLQCEFQPEIRRLDGTNFPSLAGHFPDGSHWVTLPLREQGEVTATLTLISHPADDIDDDALAMLYGLSVDLSLALNGYVKEALRQQAEQELQLAAKVFESNREGVLITDARQRILSVNKAFSKVTGYLPEEVIGQTPALLSSGQQDASFYLQMWTSLKQQGYWQGEIWNRRRSGEVYPELLSISVIKDGEGCITHYIGVFSDITETKQDQQRLDFLAHHDPLTGLPNRTLLRDRVDTAIAHAKRHQKRVGLIFFDLDNFKSVNDSLGHPVGDQVLIAVVERMLGCLRSSDTLSRLGGDEFVAVISDLRDEGDAATVARKILAAMETPIQQAGHSFNLTFSIGIALYPDDGNDFDSLLRNADAAMYHAKKSGKRTYHFFEEAMNAGAMEKLRLQSSLFHAAERGELHLAYQPQTDIERRRIIGAEALLRWNSKEHGFVSPGQFIPIAEESGFILAIGDWVLEEACRQTRAWLDAGLPEIVVAINISGLQFKHGKLVERVTELLERYAIPAGCLELEITESTMLQDDDVVLDAVTALRQTGVLLSIDDFGTGYSNLAYLRKFNADKLKIDQSFVRVMSDSDDDATLVHTIIQMAQNLKLKTIAEGVETETQLAQLKALGCDEIQGYLFSKPLPPEQFASLLRQHNPSEPIAH